HATGQAGQECRRQEHRHQHQRDADDRADQLAHGGARGSSRPDMPFSMLWTAPSTTTMASSTTMPIASTIANTAEKLTVNPSAAMAANAPMMVTGTVVAGISIARQSCRNTRMTTSTRTAASYSVLYTSWIDCSTNLVVSKGMSEISPCGNSRLSTASLSRTSFATLSAFAPGAW